MNRKRIIFGCIILGLILALRFIPVAKKSGIIQMQSGSATTCIGYSEQQRSYRILFGDKNAFDKVTNDSVKFPWSGGCGYAPLKARLYIL